MYTAATQHCYECQMGLHTAFIILVNIGLPPSRPHMSWYLTMPQLILRHTCSKSSGPQILQICLRWSFIYYQNRYVNILRPFEWQRRHVQKVNLMKWVMKPNTFIFFMIERIFVLHLIIIIQLEICVSSHWMRVISWINGMRFRSYYILTPILAIYKRCRYHKLQHNLSKSF